MIRCFARLWIGLLLLALPPATALGQTPRDYNDDPFSQGLEILDDERPTLSPQLRFRLLGEITLPGPLPGKGPRMAGYRVEIPVAGGVATMPVEPGAVAEILSREPGSEFDIEPWTVSPNGKRRYRTTNEGLILSEKRCKKCESGWKKRWRLRVPGSASVPPLLHEKRLFVPAADNIIYCVKAGNGHQVWTSDVGTRIGRPLVIWTGGGLGGLSTSSSPLVPTVILVVPNSGSELVALSGDTGQRVARISLARGEGTLVGVPVLTDDGRILIAHQKYEESEAALWIYSLDLPGLPEFDPPAFPESLPETESASTPASEPAD